MPWSGATARVAEAVGRTFNRGAMYSPTDSSPITLTKAPFDAEYISVELVDGVAVESKRPVISILKAEIDPIVPAQGDRVTVDSVVYTVREVRPDPEGQMYELDLFKV